METNKVLFHTEAVNENGVNGIAYIKHDGLSVEVSNPISEEEGTNPEELLGLSLSTCLNATIKSLLSGRGLTNSSMVEVHVDLYPEPIESGLFFKVTAYARIEDMPFEKAQKIIEQAKKRCPVSKLLKGSSMVTVEAIQ